MVVVAQQGVSSGLAALLIAAVPLWIVLLRALTGDRPRTATIAGVGVGVVGLAVLVLAGPASGGVQGTTWWGPWLVLLAGLGWATGTFATTRLPVPPNPFALAAVQMLTGGVVLLAVGTVLGERLDVTGVSTAAWVAWAYLSMVVTLGAFSAYAFALASLPVSTVATYAYVNPVIAVALGALRGGGAVHGPPAGGRRGGAARRGAGRLGGAAVPETPPENVRAAWQHPGYDSARSRSRRSAGPRPGGPCWPRRGSPRRARPGWSPGATSPRSSSGCASCSSIRSTSPFARTTCRCSPASGRTTGRWSTMRRGRTRRAARGCWWSTGPTRPAWCRWPIGRCCCPGPSGAAGGSTTRRSSSRSPPSSTTCWRR